MTPLATATMELVSGIEANLDRVMENELASSIVSLRRSTPEGPPPHRMGRRALGVPRVGGDVGRAGPPNCWETTCNPWRPPREVQRAADAAVTGAVAIRIQRPWTDRAGVRSTCQLP